MTEERKTQKEPREPMGILACLSAGFDIVARHPTMIILPLLFDLFLWLGPRLSLAPIFVEVGQFCSTYSSVQESPALLVVDQLLRALAQMFNIGIEQLLHLVAEMSEAVATRYNLFTALSPGPLLGAPTVMAARFTVERPMGMRPEIVVASPFVACAWIVLLSVVGLGISALYLRGVGWQVIAETESALPGPQSILTLWKQFIILALTLLFVLGSLGFVGFSFVMLIGLLNRGLAYFALTLSFAVLVFVAFHFIFAIPGMVQLRRSPLYALQESILLTRVDFVNVSFLVLLILVITRGLNVVWRLPDPATWATLIGIAGHAFVGTALITTLFVFYQDRLNFLPTMEKARAPQEIPAHS